MKIVKDCHLKQQSNSLSKFLQKYLEALQRKLLKYSKGHKCFYNGEI